MNEPQTNSLLTSTPTLGQALLDTAEKYPHNPLLIFPDQRTSYSEMVERAWQQADRLHALGIGPGDHVGILMPNCPEYLELLFGTVLLGAMAVPINARNKAAELAYVIDNSDIKVLLTNDLASEYVNFATLLHSAFDDLDKEQDPTHLKLARAKHLRNIVLLGDSTSKGMLTGDEFYAAGQTALERTAPNIEPTAPCIMMYTSGTTANPKGCPIGSSALVANGRAMNRQRYFMDDTDRFWSPLPMFHMSSILPLAACIDAGAALLSMNHFDATTALDMLEQENVSIAFPSFPTITNELISHPSFARRDLSRLRRINNVAPIEMLRKFQTSFPQAVQTGAYGLTEACGVIAYNHPEESLETRLHSCGQPFEGIDIKIVDPETLRTVATGERGEIWIKGYCVFSGYYKAPEKNAEAFHDNWFRTGDLCSVDEDNRISFHGRIKDMLKVGGENVAAIEIESFLSGHPAVKLAQVIGVPDDHLLEVPAAYIELNNNQTLTEESLINWCKGEIASFKIPRHVRFVTEWPMSSTKVQKFRLLEQFERE